MFFEKTGEVKFQKFIKKFTLNDLQEQNKNI